MEDQLDQRDDLVNHVRNDLTKLCKEFFNPQRRREKETQPKGAPEREEITNTGVTKNVDVMMALRECANWICFAAEEATLNQQDVVAANKLLERWRKLKTGVDNNFVAATVRDKSLDEIVDLLLKAFQDIYDYVLEQNGGPVLKPGAVVSDD